MAQQQQTAAVTALYVDLQRAINNGDHEKALKVSSKLFGDNPADDRAFHCKIVSFIQLGKFDDALLTMKKNQELATALPFEKAYCEYRLNRTAEALRTLRNLENPDTRCQELLAQVLYRLEEHRESLSVYRSLMKNTQDDYEEERETNMSAVQAAIQTFSEEPEEDLGLREDTYELRYNAACFKLGAKQYEAAIEKLDQAEKLCREQYEDDPDTTEEDIDAELGIIRVQKAYALQCLGRIKEATELYNQVAKQKPDDIALNAVLSNNIITLNKDQNVFDSKKKIKAATIQRLQQKLSSLQRRAISMNQCLLYMYTNQGELCRKTAQSLQKIHPDMDEPTLIECAQHCRDKQVAKAIDALQRQIDICPSLRLQLMLAQLHLQQGHVAEACKALRNLGDSANRPGVVSALASLYVSMDEPDMASDVLLSAIDWHKQRQPESEEHLTLIRANANFQLKMGSPEVATRMLEELIKRNPGDVKTLAHLISAYSKFDPQKAQQASKSLPPLENLAQDVDIESLEASINLLSQKYKKVAASQKPLSPKSGEDVIVAKKKNKKKKNRKPPKNFDPKATPDPERWLPMRERSYYRGKRHKRREGVGKGTQGATAGASQDLDASNPTPSSPRVGSGAASPAIGSAPGSAATAPRQQKPMAGKSKKKKKGGKW
ncbi:hypothetical protein CAPTEDRAFT_98316 [Capitella teleta]|uniref:Signal recognition particle subunit SRP72 n=1 Tax=Capitella teleta TaxID=283909 RepID=R7V5J6_CAPTE|nr:hypothetical protein CAPTEDRAFT_98316 [Capitella teleta]|eukprot:ELU13722.1 hypothetical protein CAPTEDRAFT_98316 [Capitella teleta]